MLRIPKGHSREDLLPEIKLLSKTEIPLKKKNKEKHQQLLLMESLNKVKAISGDSEESERKQRQKSWCTIKICTVGFTYEKTPWLSSKNFFWTHTKNSCILPLLARDKSNNI